MQGSQLNYAGGTQSTSVGNRVSHTNEEMATLNDSIISLQDALNTLQDRMLPVLFSNPLNEKNSEIIPERALAPLAARVREHRNKVEAMFNQVQFLLNSLEV